MPWPFSTRSRKMMKHQSDGRLLHANNISFMVSLSAIDSHNQNDSVHVLWNGILNTCFPPYEPYRIGVKGIVLRDDSAPESVVFDVRAYAVPAGAYELHQRQIFMMECKGAGEDYRGGWDKAETQLLEHMKAHVNDSWSSGMYGACAIGRKIVFYEWTLESRGLTPISRALDLAVPVDRPVIEEWLDYIRQQGWNRTG